MSFTGFKITFVRYDTGYMFSSKIYCLMIDTRLKIIYFGIREVHEMINEMTYHSDSMKHLIGLSTRYKYNDYMLGYASLLVNHFHIHLEPYYYARELDQR